MKISVLLLAIVFMNCSCEKNDLVVPDDALTLDKLQGEWVSTLYEYNSVPYLKWEDCLNTNEPDLLYENAPDGIAIRMLIRINVTGDKCDISDNCVNPYPSTNINISYDSENNLILLDNGTYTFKVLDYYDVNKIIKLELTYESVGFVTTGGIYTLEKQ